MSVPLGTTHSSLSTAHMPVLGCSNMVIRSWLALGLALALGLGLGLGLC